LPKDEILSLRVCHHISNAVYYEGFIQNSGNRVWYPFVLMYILSVTISIYTAPDIYLLHKSWRNCSQRAMLISPSQAKESEFRFPFIRSYSQNRVSAASFLRFLDHTQKHASGRTLLDEWSARHRGRYLHNTQISQHSTEFESAIPVFKWLLPPYASDRTATRIESRTFDLL
jgi:hypothetical protein